MNLIVIEGPRLLPANDNAPRQMDTCWEGNQPDVPQQTMETCWEGHQPEFSLRVPAL